MSHLRGFQLGLGSAVAVFILLVPFLLPEIGIHLAVEVLIYALFAVSFNILLGYCGMLPFGHAAFFGAGGYTVALILRNFPGTPLLLTFLIAALLALVIGASIGVFCVRLSGAYFSLISIASQMFLFAVALKWRSLTSGDDGMTFTRPESPSAHSRRPIHEERRQYLLFHLNYCRSGNLGLLPFFENPSRKLFGLYQREGKQSFFLRV